MRIEITSKSYDLTDGMRQHIEKKLLKLKHYFDSVLDCHVFLRVERFMYKFEITLHGNGFDLFAEAQSGDLHAAFDSAAEKMERQVRKLKDKIRRRRNRRPGRMVAGESPGEEVAEEVEGKGA